jgi:hypothetical protein
MKTKSRLLGLAFAAADILIELNADGRIVFALGAAPAPGAASPETWEGRPVTDVLAESEAFETALAGLAIGVRTAAIDIVLACDGDRRRRARVRALRLPQLAPAVSCAITFEGAAYTVAVPDAPPLLSADALVERAKDVLGDASYDLALAFVDVSGLSEATGEAGQRASARVEAALQSASVDGASAARLTPER